MNNRDMAGVLFNIATVLRREGNVNPYRTAAYERCARALMGLRAEASGVLEAQAVVPFRRRQHIGKKLQAKIREMAESGALDQYVEMLETLPTPIAGLMRVPGIGPKTAERIHETLGIGTADELVRAARDGRLSRVPGFGPKRVAAIAGQPLQLAFDLPLAA